jgi:hypothetical protein
VRLRRVHPLLSLAALVLLAAALAAVIWGSVARLNLPGPTIDADDVATPAPAVTPPRPVLVVVIDGLGASAARAVPELAALAARGAWVDLAAEPPTFSAAQYVAFLTGVGPPDSGVRTNLRPRRTPLDSVVARVRAAGRRTVQVGDQVDWWGRIFAWDRALVVPPPALAAEAARLAADPASELLLVHLTKVDGAGHAHGADSDRYRREAAAAGAEVATLAARWGARGPVVVLSDHGHTARGGHGGSQPAVTGAFLIAAGAGVRAGAQVPQARMADVAPTLSALLGVPAPAHAEGRALVELLDLPTATAGALADTDARRRADASAAADRGRAPLAAAERRGQLIRAGALLLLTTGATILLRRLGPRAWRGCARGAAATVLVAGVFALRGDDLVSFSDFRSLRDLVTETGLASLVVAMLALRGPFGETIAGRLAPPDAARLAAGAAIGAAPLAAAALAQIGLFAPRLTCRPDWLVAWPTIALTVSAPFLLMAGLLAALALARLARQ